MISIKETIQRLIKSKNHLNQLQQTKIKPKPNNKKSSTPKDIEIHSKTKHVPLNTTKSTSNYHKSNFQKYLSPLNSPHLKIYKKNEWDPELAKSNWIEKKSKAPKHQLSYYINNRNAFEEMKELVLKNLPHHLKNVKEEHLKSILLEQEQLVKRRDIPSVSYDEIPQLPKNLTSASFENYVYQLCYTQFYYKNSFSLDIGIIPQILLWTHSLDNDKFKNFRSTRTFNHLIYYFGYVKNQNQFSRELLLVMNKDGHEIDIDTINLILKISKIQNGILSTTSIYKIINRYLKLSAKLGIELNLETIVRIYDLISNIHFKENYLNWLIDHQIPISQNLIIRILEDYLYTTTDTDKVIKFIESDLTYKDWRNDDTFKRQVEFHYGLTGNTKTKTKITDLKAFISGLKNSELEKKSVIMLKSYVMFNGDKFQIQIYKNIINTILKENLNLKNLKSLSFIIRGLYHEYLKASNLKTSKFSDVVPESYKNIVSKSQIHFKFQAMIEYVNTITNDKVKMPWEIFNEEEIEEWEGTKKKLTDNVFIFESDSGFEIPVELQNGIKYREEHIKAKIYSNKNRKRLILTENNDSLMKHLRERNLIEE
ncbi:unnamed protein product [Candida verbasci]|uniref:ATPase expression protein 3 n=1 Tax=Candida verbasci TaxID=1227364 RepID=A0A9W4TT84_9ASCO|nr:unnamed protein product [Candida verbasci]